MQIQLNDRLAQRLEIRAQQQRLNINAVAVEAIEHYLQQLEEADGERFRRRCLSYAAG